VTRRAAALAQIAQGAGAVFNVAGACGLGALEAATAGCEWLHVDFDEHLSGFYFDACGFAPTPAGLISLT